MADDRIHSFVAAALLGACVVCASCGKHEEAAKSEPAPTPVTRTAKGDGLDATATLENPKITMADLVKLGLSVRTDNPDVASVNVDVEKTDQWADVHQKNGSPTGRSDAGGRLVETTIVLEPFLPGELKTPKIVLTPELKAGGEGKKLTIDPMAVEVASVIKGDPATAKLADVKGVVDAPVATPWALIIGGSVVGLGVLTAAGVGVWMLRRREEAVAPPPPAHAIALEALDRLRERGLIQSGRVKEYYFELSAILRRYIEGRFGLHAPDRTTEEFLYEARGAAAMGTKDVELLERFLEHCDLVKFAKLPVGPGQAELSMDTVRDFVVRTRPQEVELASLGPGAGAPREGAAA